MNRIDVPMLSIVRAAICLVVCWSASVAAGAEPTWAERLGYPPGKRVVILHVSGLGVSYESNAAGEKALGEGLATSGAVMAACPWFEDFAAWRRGHADADVGLTLAFNSELENYRWTSVAPRGEVPGLIGGDGYLRRGVLELVYNAEPKEIEIEIEAQLRKAREAGLRPSHLTCHLGALFARHDLAAVYLGLARKHWIPATVIELTPERMRRFQDEGFPLDDEMAGLIANYPLPKLDDVRFLFPAASYAAKRQALAETIHALPPGLCQVFFRPAIDSGALRRIMPDWEQRVWDAQLLADPEVKALLKKEEVVVTSWREIMRRFDGERLDEKPKEEAVKPMKEGDPAPTGESR